ncbi:hypothetical protein ACQY0O_006761 [Thecaphora frezii]
MKKSFVQPRSVAVAIPYIIEAGAERPIRRSHIRICLVSSRKHPGDYVLPKGGIEDGEDSLQAAIRELYEEAGLKAASKWPYISLTAPYELVVADHKPHKKSQAQQPTDPGFIPRAIYTGHEVLVDSKEGQLQEWPEQDQRQRKWFSPDEALRCIAWRKDIATILELWIGGIPA